MKTDIKSLQDYFESWYSINQASREEVTTVFDMYHNRQWGREQIWELEAQGRPKETFNVIKSMTRTLVGYYSTVVNKAQVEPTTYNDITKATMLNDIMKKEYDHTDFDIVDDDIKTNAFLSGLFVSHTTVNPTGNKDMFGRNEQGIEIIDVSPDYVVLDPLSRKRDYSDARGIFSFKWMDEDSVKSEFGKNQKTIDKLNAYENHINVDEGEYTYRYDNEFTGKYKVANMYLIVHAVMNDESIYYCGDIELARTKLNYPEGLTPYTVTKVIKSNREEYYGIFHEVIEPQKAINQALVQIQLMINTNKVIVESGAVEDIDEFADTIARVNGVAEVEDLKGIQVQNLSQGVLDQYTIIDKGYQRVKQVLGINDAMLGEAYAADSARKTKLQKNTGYMTLRYLTGPLELFHKRQAILVAGLIADNFTAHQILRVTDDITGNRFIEINKPMLLPKLPPELSTLVAQGMPIEYAFEAMLTGQLNPAVQQAMQADQQAQQANQQYQQQKMEQQQQVAAQQQQLVNEGLSPQNYQPIVPEIPAPPPANNVATLPSVDLDQAAEGSQRAKMNNVMTTKNTMPNAPEGLSYMYEEIIDPETGEPETDSKGNILLMPKSEPESMIDIRNFEVTMVASSYDDEDEAAQLQLEVMLNGPVGQWTMQAAPAEFAKMVSLVTQSTKTKNSPEIAKMYNDIAMKLGANPEFEAYMRQVASGNVGQGQQGQQGQMTDDGNGGMIPPGQQGGGPQSSTLKLPQNTNQGM
ncbi:MAG: hypothetical protein DRI37_01730 [Chloroflexi bacterium]|nr:MAG: hypothetical protein DRI37_01730 [Chloroflexota bacterium]